MRIPKHTKRPRFYVSWQTGHAVSSWSNIDAAINDIEQRFKGAKTCRIQFTPPDFIIVETRPEPAKNRIWRKLGGGGIYWIFSTEGEVQPEYTPAA
jgi:hypothetical protein